MRRRKDQALPFEIVSFFIYDLGRSVDLSAARAAVQAAGYPTDEAQDGQAAARGRDTPASLSLPEPLRFSAAPARFERLADAEAEVKVYDDGAMTIVVRRRCDAPLDGVSDADKRPLVRTGDRDLNAAAWAELLFREVLAAVGPAVVSPVQDGRRDRETYTAFCLLDCPGKPQDYAEKRRREIAALIIGEDDAAALHESQIDASLSRPFSYRDDDLAVFDMDRCFLIARPGDYEDILLIVEHASYRLLELRALDQLLDVRLEEAEKDLYAKIRRGGRLKGGSPQKKFARIQALRFEALFILENLENSSKIIGDFYLCQIYDRLCGILNTEGWKRSVERRLDILSSVYDMAKTDSAQRRSLVLEIIFIAVCVILPVLQIWQALLLD
jgi:hypothetical protein